MSKYNFNLKNKSVLDGIRSPNIYRFNLARNMALLSNDPAVIRYFYQIEAPKLMTDQWLQYETKDKFMAQHIDGQAFSYFGICPMIVQGKVGLVASGGFECASNDKHIDDVLNRFKKEADLEKLFASGVYLESGLGDCLYRISYNPNAGNRPIVSLIEPQMFEVNYKNGEIISYVIKAVNDDDNDYEIREIFYKNEQGKVCVMYRFYYDGKYVDPSDKSMMKQCIDKFGKKIDITPKVLPFDEFPLVFKKNSNANQLYKGERGVPDIHGLDTIEDALTETISDLIDAIRKGGIKEYVDEDLIPQTADGQQLRRNPFNKTIITTKGSSSPVNSEELFKVVQGNINWEAYTRTIQNLMSIAINKAGMSPTTIGLTGLESINSSAESQDARERTSIRTRELALKSWEVTLTDLLNKYLQVLDYINGQEILDYKELIKIKFPDYINPSVENVTNVLANQVAAGLKSRKRAIKELNDEFNDEDVDKEMLDILAENGQPVLQDGLISDGNMENNTPNSQVAE